MPKSKKKSDRRRVDHAHVLQVRLENAYIELQDAQKAAIKLESRGDEVAGETADYLVKVLHNLKKLTKRHTPYDRKGL